MKSLLRRKRRGIRPEEIKKTIRVPFLTLMILASSLPSAIPAQAEGSEDTDAMEDLSSMPDMVTVTYDDYVAEWADEEVTTPSETESKEDNSVTKDYGVDGWVPFCDRNYTGDADREFFKAHSPDQTENWISVATLYNHPEMRKAVEDLLTVDKLYRLNGAYAVTKDDEYGKGADVSLNVSLYENSDGIKKTVLAEDESGAKIRKQLSKITSETLGLESNLPSSWAVPLYIYYNRLDNARGLLELPSSLNDSISKRDFLFLTMATTNSFGSTCDTIEKNYLYREDDERYDPGRFKDVQDMLNLGRELADTKYEEGVISAYYARNLTNGTFYGLEDASKESLDSKMTRLEALYNISDDLYTGWGDVIDAAGMHGRCLDDDEIYSYSKPGWFSGKEGYNDYDNGQFTIVKYYSLSDISMDEIAAYVNPMGGIDNMNESYTSKLDGVTAELEKKVVNTKKIKTGKKKVTKWEMESDGDGSEVRTKMYKYQKKVKGKIKYKWTSNGYPDKGWKHVYKATYKTIEETEDAIKVIFNDKYYTEDGIKYIKDKFKEYFRDVDQYHIMSLKELEEAQDKINFYDIWLRQGRSAAYAKLNAYAMSKHVLTPEMAGRLVKGYEKFCFTVDVDGNLDLYSEVTWDDVLAWNTFNKAHDALHVSLDYDEDGRAEYGKAWSGYKDALQYQCYYFDKYEDD